MLRWKFKNQEHRPIGLDIGHDSIKMLQLAINGGQTSVLAAEKVRIDPYLEDGSAGRRKFIISAIRQMLNKGTFKGRNVISCLANDKVKITSLRLAEGDSESIERALKKEIEQRFGMDSHKDAINYVVAGNIRQGEEVKSELIVFAADNEIIKEHISILEEAELKPTAIDTIPCALLRSFERLRRRSEDRENTVVFVDVGSRYTTVVFGRRGEISFAKQIPIGGEKFNHEVASRLGISVIEASMLREKLRTERNVAVPQMAAGEHEDQNLWNSGIIEQGVLDGSTRQAMVDAVSSVAEELAREISQCFRYHTVTFRGKRVERVIFTGGGAYENILLVTLKQHLTVEIEVAQPLKGVDMVNTNFGNDRRDLLCEWTVAVGLSLKGWDCDGISKDNGYERN